MKLKFSSEFGAGQLDLGGNLSKETLHGVAGARVVWLDRDLLAIDYPFTLGLTNDELEHWLIQNAAWISSSQALENAVNSKVEVSCRRVEAYRPPRYGRAAVVPVEYENHRVGFFDLKGIGVTPQRRPRNVIDSSGLLKTSSAFRELVYERILRQMGERSGLSCVKTYAIVDLGFSGCDFKGGEYPACVLVRSLHVRNPLNIDLHDEESPYISSSIAVEFFLRQYGITSCCPITRLRLDRHHDMVKISYGKTLRKLVTHTRFEALTGVDVKGESDIDCINVQMCALDRYHNLRLYDFGQYEFRAHFEFEVMCLVANKPYNFGLCFDSDDELSCPQPQATELLGRLREKKSLPKEVSDYLGFDKLVQVDELRMFSLEILFLIGTSKTTVSEVNSKVETFVSSISEVLLDRPVLDFSEIERRVVSRLDLSYKRDH